MKSTSNKTSAIIIVLALVAVLAMASCGPGGMFDEPLSIVTSEQGPSFDPAVLVVRGTRGDLTVRNTLDAEHGFSIQGAGIKRVVKAGESVKISMKGLKAADYEIFCQLHDLKTGKGKHRRSILRVAP